MDSPFYPHGNLKNMLMDYLDIQDQRLSKPRTREWKEKIISNVFSILESDSETAQKIRGSYYRPMPDGFVSFFGEKSYLSFREHFQRDCPFEYTIGRTNPYTSQPVETKDDYELYCLAHYLRLYAEDQLIDLKTERDLYFSELQKAREDVLLLEHQLDHRHRRISFSPPAWLFSILIFLCIFFGIAFFYRPSQADLDAVNHAYAELKQDNAQLEQSNGQLLNDVSSLTETVMDIQSQIITSTEAAYKAGFLQSLVHTSGETYSSEFFSFGKQYAVEYEDLMSSYFEKWLNSQN